MRRGSSAISKAEHERLRFLRWVLFLVNCAESAGVGSLDRPRLHALLFVSFSSSRFYGIQPLRQRAQRTPQGPYYRAAHVALGVLALAGLIELRGFEAHPSAKDLQLEGTFGATPAGLEAAGLMRQTHTGAALYRYLLDLCLGTVSALMTDGPAAQDTSYAAVAILQDLSNGADNGSGDKRFTTELDVVLEKDLTYQRAIHQPGKSLLIEETLDEVTPTVQGLRSIESYLRDRIPVNGRDVLGAYQRLLQKRVA